MTTHEGVPREFLGAKVIGSQRWLLLFFLFVVVFEIFVVAMGLLLVLFSLAS